jgi:DnaJ-class molecular chaperone
MGKDYYEILGVSPSAPTCDISARFRQLALTYHPQKNKANMAKCNFIFSEVCEAYEVLSNRK